MTEARSSEKVAASSVRGKPNFEGQKSDAEWEKEPLYEHAIVERDMFNCGGLKYTYSIYDSSGKKVEFLRAEVEPWTLKLNMMIFIHGSKTCVAKVGQTTMLQFSNANEYGVEVTKGMDPLSAICFAISSIGLCNDVVKWILPPLN